MCVGGVVSCYQILLGTRDNYRTIWQWQLVQRPLMGKQLHLVQHGKGPCVGNLLNFINIINNNKTIINPTSTSILNHNIHWMVQICKADKHKFVSKLPTNITSLFTKMTRTINLLGLRNLLFVLHNLCTSMLSVINHKMPVVRNNLCILFHFHVHQTNIF